MTTTYTMSELNAVGDAFEDLPQERQQDLLEEVDAQVAPLLHHGSCTDPVFIAEVCRLLAAGNRDHAMAWIHLARWKSTDCL
jgi:hypothetical protein